jgi:hypothetical protein
MATKRAIAGARAKLYFNGTTLAGWATGVSATENIQLQRVDVLGDIDSKEIEPVGRTVTLQADFVRITGEGLADMGIWPDGGTLDVINFPEMTAEIQDDYDSSVVHTISGLRAESRNWRVDRSGVMTQNATFQARAMSSKA